MCWKIISSASQMTVHNPKDTATIANQAAEIDRLKAELEMRTKERDQAIENGGVDDCSPDYPDLYEHFKRKAQAHKDFLAGRGE